jgi:hypothetical protein
VRKPNAWYSAICAQLGAAKGPLSVEQIWQGMETSGFQHRSEMPRSTLGARIAELVQLKKLVRVGPGTYQLLGEP